jgi:hypothetical protein
MGGIGSGWQCERKLAVEDCLTLPASLFRRKVAEGAFASGTVSWSHPGADPFASIRYAATLSHDGSGYIRLRYMARGESMDYRVRLVTTRPNYGGLRWWFLCPVSAERGIEKRAAKLYLPPRAKVFGCREAHDLTYQSCRESWQFRNLFARLAAAT